MKKACLLASLAVVLLSFNASACFPGMYFWDTNGSTPGSGGGAPTGTWGVDAAWNTDFLGGGAGTIAWPAGQIAVFSAGDDATGAYTIYVQGTQQAADIHVDQGTVTFEPAPGTGGGLDLVALGSDAGCPDRNNRLLSVGEKSASSVATYNVPLTGANGIIRYKRATLILGATNTYTGSTTIEGGVLELGAPYVMPTNSTLVLANDDGRSDVYRIGLSNNTPATLATGGFSQKLGALKLAGPVPAVARSIDFGHGASALAFADSSGQSWTSKEGLPIPLHILNYTLGVESLRFGTNAGGLTQAQLAVLRFVDFAGLPGRIDAQGYVTPAFPVIQSIRRTSP